MDFFDIVRRLERDARLYRAELRQLELDVGRSASADGRYWLERTAALEHVASLAERGEPLQDALQTLREVRARACNPNDHKEKHGHAQVVRERA